MSHNLEVKDNKFSGIGLICDTVTPANRIYPRFVIEKALIEFQKKIEQNNAFLLTSKFDTFNGIDINSIIGLITSASLCGNEVIITGELLKTDYSKSFNNRTLHVFSGGYGCYDIDYDTQTVTMKDDFELEHFIVEERE